jgi:segregation and condensation protein B
VPNGSAPSHLVRQLEALLFVASEPITATHLAKAIGADAATVTAALETLGTILKDGGLRLSVLDGKYRLVTAPDTADIVRTFLQAEAKADLSRAALETLAIIAYRGPLTKTAIEQVRGVASDTMLRNLAARGLISEAGKSPEPGRPALYAVSHTFLQHFGFTSPADLPPVPTEPPPAPTDPPSTTGAVS